MSAVRPPLIAVEPAGFDGMGHSLTHGEIETMPLAPSSICDGLMARRPGVAPFAALRTARARGLAVSDASVRKAPPPAADAWAELTTASARVPDPLRTLWQQMSEADATLALGALRELWGQQLATEVTPACSRAVDGRYPLCAKARKSVARGGPRVFRRRRRDRQLFQRYLAGWVDTSTRPWGYAWRRKASGVTRCCCSSVRRPSDRLFQRRRAAARRAHGPAAARARPRHRALTIDRRPAPALCARHAQRADPARPGPGGAGRIQLQANAPGANAARLHL
jgi:hypothetical protein